MRVLLAILSLLLPVSSHAILAFDFDGIVTGYGTGEPAPDDRVGKRFNGSLRLDENATETRFATVDRETLSEYKVNGSFTLDFGDRQLTKTGILDICVVNRGGLLVDSVIMRVYEAKWSDVAEMAYGEFGWTYAPGTFNGTGFENLNQRGPFLAGYGHTKRYIGSEIYDHWDSHSEFSQVVSAGTETDIAPTPEPGTMALMGIGLVGLYFKRRKN